MFSFSYINFILFFSLLIEIGQISFKFDQLSSLTKALGLKNWSIKVHMSCFTTCDFATDTYVLLMMLPLRSFLSRGFNNAYNNCFFFFFFFLVCVQLMATIDWEYLCNKNKIIRYLLLNKMYKWVNTLVTFWILSTLGAFSQTKILKMISIINF